MTSYRKGTKRPANGVEHASLLLMPIDTYPKQMWYVTLQSIHSLFFFPLSTSAFYFLNK